MSTLSALTLLKTLSPTPSASTECLITIVCCGSVKSDPDNGAFPPKDALAKRKFRMNFLDGYDFLTAVAVLGRQAADMLHELRKEVDGRDSCGLRDRDMSVERLRESGMLVTCCKHGKGIGLDAESRGLVMRMLERGRRAGRCWWRFMSARGRRG